MKMIVRRTALAVCTLVLAVILPTAASAACTRFDDVPESADCYESVMYLAEHEITQGTGNGCFSPDAPGFHLCVPCFFLLQTLIFRTGNGHHFFRVTCLHFSVFHANIKPQSAAKNQYFQWFLDILPCSDCAQSCHRTVGFRLFDLQSLHEPAVLLRC